MSCTTRLGETVTEVVGCSRDIDLLVIHCSATPYGRYHDAYDINKWHTEDNGWDSIGYHYVILVDGTIQYGRDADCEGAHASGYNNNSIGICLIGGTDENIVAYDNGYSKVQYQALYGLLNALEYLYPDSDIKGHRELPDVNKACPSLSNDYLDLIRELVYA